MSIELFKSFQNKNNTHLSVGVIFMAEKEGFVCIFICDENHTSLTLPKEKTTPFGVVFLWRRRRDLNPRYPFGVYTISNRARSASYATSPCRPRLQSACV